MVGLLDRDLEGTAFLLIGPTFSKTCSLGSNALVGDSFAPLFSGHGLWGSDGSVGKVFSISGGGVNIPLMSGRLVGRDLIADLEARVFGLLEGTGDSEGRKRGSG